MGQLLVVVVVVVAVWWGGGLLCYIFLAAWAFLWLWKVEATLHLQCMGFSLQWPLLLQRTGSRGHGLQ